MVELGVAKTKTRSAVDENIAGISSISGHLLSFNMP
jgi:hypothetical protein